MSTILTQLYYDGVWNTVASFTAEGWTFKRGPSLQGGTEPSSLEWTMDNRDLSMDPTNPLSPLYRKIGRNTSARLAINSNVVTAGEASSWKPTRTVEHQVSPARGRAQTQLTADGILRRLGRWDDTLRSPMSRQIGKYTGVTGNWMLEDSGTTRLLYNAVPGGAPGRTSGTVTPAGDDGSGGTSAAVVIGTDGRMDFNFKNPTPLVSGYQLSIVIKLANLPSSGTYIAMFQWTDTNANTWYWRVNNGAYEIAIYAPDGSLLDSGSVSWGTGVVPTAWTRYVMKVTTSGTVTRWDASWYPQDASAIYSAADTSIAGLTGTTSGLPRSLAVVANTYTDGASFNALFCTTDTSLDLLASFDAYAAFNGYVGESAGDRFVRLMRENNIDHLTFGTANLSARMGRQSSSSLMELLEELARTDGGLLFDDNTTVSGRCRLAYRMNNDMLNQTPLLALTYGTNLAPPFDKTIDDQQLANDITGKNWDGTEVRLEDSTSYMGTLPPPLGVGRYTGSIDMNMQFAAGVADRVSWQLRNNTLDGARYASVTVDLLANPSLTATVNTLKPGDLITVSGVEPQAIRLIVINFTRSGGPVTDSITMNCLPGDLYETGKYDDASHRYDSKSTTLSSGINSSVTTVPIFSADPMDKWSTTPGYGIWIGPERCTVTACTAGSASGTGWAQSMTVTRGVNGVAIAHLSGEAVKVYNPMVYSMRIASNP